MLAVLRNPPRSSFHVLLVLFSVALFAAPARSLAAPTPGFVDHLTSGIGQWGGGDFYSNPGTGGVLGAGDGYLLVTTPGPSPFFTGNLAARSLDTPYAGNWTAAGVTKVKFYLNDVGNADAGLEIHFCVGNGANFWQYNPGFIPPVGSWTQFTVDLGSTNWTQIVGTGTLSAALAAADRILIRHDKAPYAQNPDPISADVGIDEISEESGGSTGVPLPRLTGPLALTLAAPSPNPSRGAVALAIAAPDASPISIQIVDALGRIIRRATLAGAAGSRLWTWDGHADDGTPAPAGVYRARAWNASGGMSRSLVRIAGTR